MPLSISLSTFDVDRRLLNQLAEIGNRYIVDVYCRRLTSTEGIFSHFREFLLIYSITSIVTVASVVESEVEAVEVGVLFSTLEEIFGSLSEIST